MKYNEIHYVYTLQYPESMGGKVFYVGEGKYDRIDHHEKEAKRGIQTPKCDVIRHIWANGEQIVKKKVAENLTKIKARRLEDALIEQYGKENLTNRTTRTEAQIQSFSDTMRASWQRRNSIPVRRIHHAPLIPRKEEQNHG